MELIDNINRLLGDDLKQALKPGARLKVAAQYEGAVVRPLGYPLEHTGQKKPASAPRPYADDARHFAPLDPGAKPVVTALAKTPQRDAAWKLLIHEPIEVDA